MIPFQGMKAFVYYIRKSCKRGSVLYVMPDVFAQDKIRAYMKQGCVVRSTIKRSEESLDSAIRRVMQEDYDER